MSTRGAATSTRDQRAPADPVINAHAATPMPNRDHGKRSGGSSVNSRYVARITALTKPGDGSMVSSDLRISSSSSGIMISPSGGRSHRERNSSRARCSWAFRVPSAIPRTRADSVMLALAECCSRSVIAVTGRSGSFRS